MTKMLDLWYDWDRRYVMYYGAGVLVAGWVGTKLWSRHNRNMRASKRLAISNHRDTKLAELGTKLAQLELDRTWALGITRLSLDMLIVKLKSGELSVVDVLRAYQLIALEAHDITNCITNVFDDAESLAEELERRTGAERKGLLYGVPVSIKDNIATKGHINTSGTLNLADNYGTCDALVVKMLRAEGAIPFVKTNLPQLAMSYESSNAIYGTTLNPRDVCRTPGGSSGGESALVAYGGSPLGVGTDIAGSIRIPAAFTGICGLKPTTSRVSQKGRAAKGQRILLSSVGPMTRDVDSLATFTRAVLSQQTFHNDGFTPPIPFNEDIYQDKKPLKIGFFVNDGYYPACPANARAVMVTKLILERQGHKLIPWTPPDVTTCAHAVFTALSGDRGVTLIPLLTEDDVDPCLYLLNDALCASPIKRYIRYWLNKLQGKTRLADMYRFMAGKSTVGDWFKFTEETINLYRRFEEDWRKHDLDALICPSHIIPASHLGEYDDLLQCGNYNFIYNLLDVPAGVVPVTKVTSADITAARGRQMNDHINKFVLRTLEGAEGLPVGVQCVTMKWQEELCLRLMRDVERGRDE